MEYFICLEPVYIETKESMKEDICSNVLGCANFRKWFYYSLSPEALTPEEEASLTAINILMGKKKDKRNVHFTHIADLIRCRQVN